MMYKFLSLFFLCVFVSSPYDLFASKSKKRLQQAHGIHHQNKLYDVNQTKRKNTKKSKKAHHPAEDAQEQESKVSEV